MTVLLLTDREMERHPAPAGHPERPARLAAAAAGVSDAASRLGAELRQGGGRAASAEELQRVHPAAFLERLRSSAAGGGGWLDPDTIVGSASLAAASHAAGTTIDAALAIAEGSAAVAFAVVRPPGHHAGASRGAGFCLLNNVALAAEALRASGMAARVAILDWDVHHGDGTQSIYDADPDVFYASTHEWGLYPGTGSADEVGVGPAAGTKRNCPLEPGSGDEAFLEAWSATLLPELVRFGPDAILVSAGYDAHAFDPLSRLEVTADAYRRLGEAVGATVRRLGIGGVALALEGGYDLDALRSSADATVDGLLVGLGAG